MYDYEYPAPPAITPEEYAKSEILRYLLTKEMGPAFDKIILDILEKTGITVKWTQ